MPKWLDLMNEFIFSLPFLLVLVGGPRVETLPPPPPPPPWGEILDLYWIEVYPIPILN